MKKNIIIFMLSIAVISSYAGFGDFLSKTAKVADAVITSSNNLTGQKDEATTQLAQACSSFADAKAKAYEAIGNTSESKKLDMLVKSLKDEKNIENLSKYLDGEKKANALCVLQDAKIVGDDSKAKILQSIQSFANGVREEVLLGKQLAELSKEAQRAISNASAVEKVKLVSDLTPLIGLAERFPADIKNAKDTLNGYINYAKSNGIDVSAIAAGALK